jgi:hypothetical protein
MNPLRHGQHRPPKLPDDPGWADYPFTYISGAGANRSRRRLRMVNWFAGITLLLALIAAIWCNR